MASMTKEAFSQLVVQYERLVYTICFQLVRDAAAAEDLTQETFLSAYLHRDTMPAGYERQWLTICKAPITGAQFCRGMRKCPPGFPRLRRRSPSSEAGKRIFPT